MAHSACHQQSRRAGYLRLNTACRHRASLGLGQLQRYLSLQELALGLFPLPGISPNGTSWQHQISASISLSVEYLKKIVVSSEGQGAPVITGLMLKLLPDVDTSLSKPLECWLPQEAPVSCWEGQREHCVLLAKQCMAILTQWETLWGLEEEVKACTARVFILTCLFVNALCLWQQRNLLKAGKDHKYHQIRSARNALLS